jgi:hypothetical protein
VTWKPRGGTLSLPPSVTTGISSKHQFHLTIHLTLFTPRPVLRLGLEFSPYNSGNRNAKVLSKLKAVRRDDALVGWRRARIVIFANAHARAAEMGVYPSENEMPNIVLTAESNDNKGQGRSGRRVYGANKHLAGILKPILNKDSSPHSNYHMPMAKRKKKENLPRT